MDKREATEYRIIVHLHMSRKRCIIGKNGIVAHNAIMRDMDSDHDPVIMSDAGNPPALNRAAIKGAIFPDDITITDLQKRHFAGIFLVLGIIS